MEECRFIDRISEFVEYYSVINTGKFILLLLNKRMKQQR